MNFLRKAVVITTLGIVGCTNPAKVCTLEGTIAIRLVARDAQSLMTLKGTMVTASVGGVQVSPFGIGPSADSSVTLIYGGAGVYDVTARKDGYTDASQRVTVNYGGECQRTITEDATITLARKP